VDFPYYLQFGPLRLHPHWVFEGLAYAVAFHIYLRLRRSRGDSVSEDIRWWVIAAAAAGAALGSKLLYWLEEPSLTLAHWNDPAYLMGGKTIVGALVGGLICVEWAKRRLGVAARTGDLFAVPLALGIAIGRIGCFLTGLPDHTYGTPTRLPWGVNFGDSIPRHPTQLYEIAFLTCLAALLWWFVRRPHSNGDVFKAFMVGYMGFRLLVDFLKPEATLAGLSSIQWAATLMLVYYGRDVRRWIEGGSSPKTLVRLSQPQ
jgi:prolipoprotein diacylglyceryltransferase